MDKTVPAVVYTQASLIHAINMLQTKQASGLPSSDHGSTFSLRFAPSLGEAKKKLPADNIILGMHSAHIPLHRTRDGLFANVPFSLEAALESVHTSEQIAGGAVAKDIYRRLTAAFQLYDGLKTYRYS